MRALAVLLRGIGPTTHVKMPMTALAEACRTAGLPETRNHLASGNLTLRTDRPVEEVARIVLDLLAAKGVQTKAILRDAAALRATLAGCPDPEACAARPAQVQVTFLASPLTAEALAALQARAQGERVEALNGDLWIDYRGGIAASKLTGVVIERLTGTVATARNWRTLQRLVAAL